MILYKYLKTSNSLDFSVTKNLMKDLCSSLEHSDFRYVKNELTNNIPLVDIAYDI